MMAQVKEILGYTFEEDRQSDRTSRAYYVRADSPEDARSAFKAFAAGLPLADGFSVDGLNLDEEKGANGLYFGTISFRSQRVKAKIAEDLEELFGEKIGEDRKSGTHEKTYRVKADSARAALDRLEGYVRESLPRSGRLHLNGINVDENADGDGWYSGRVSYANPSQKGDSDRFAGIVPAFGERITTTKDGTTAERVFEMRGFEDAKAAKAALVAQYLEPGVEEISVEEDSGGAKQLYIGRIRYSNESDLEENGDEEGEDAGESLPEMQFEISGTTQKVTLTKGTLGVYVPKGKNYPVTYGLIGATKDSVEGVDLPVPEGSFSETHYFPPSFLTASYIAFLNKAYGRINSAPFRGFAAGEVQFLGVTGSHKKGDREVELSFRFAISENVKDLYVGEIGPIEKPGWAYLWVRYDDGVDNSSKSLVKMPSAVFVEKVCDELDFGLLGIG